LDRCGKPIRICDSDLKNELLAWSAIGENPTAMRVDPLDLKREDVVPAHKASPVQLSAEHERELNDLARAHSTPQKLAERARIILLAAAGLGVRRRWRDAAASAGVAARLSAVPRCGAPAKFTPEAVCQIIALAYEKPETLDVPDLSLESKRTSATIGGARHCQKHFARLNRALFKREADLKPHRNRYWLTAKPDPDFDTKCADICAVYQAAPTAAERDAQTVSIDEMTGIQALEWAAPGLPMKPGHVERESSSISAMAPKP
jgi:hypothetical protein